MPKDGVPEKKSVTLGVTLLVFGICALALAAVIYSPLQENKDRLEVKEINHLDTPEDHQIVALQTTAVLGGFIVGGAVLLVGIVVLSLAMSYNSKIDAVTLQRDLSPQNRAQTMPSNQPSFCAYCGQPTQGTPFCIYCGKNTSP